MSRIGKQTIKVPVGVTVQVENGFLVVTGPKARLTRPIHEKIMVTIGDQFVTVDVANKEEKKERSLWGTFAAHIKNMVNGVSTGFRKQLEIHGVGYRVTMQGKDLSFEVGFSHPVVYHMPVGAQASVEKNVIMLESADKELLGQIAAEVRAIRPPEPYKGKGIRYSDEILRRKAGKTAAKGA